MASRSVVDIGGMRLRYQASSGRVTKSRRTSIQVRRGVWGSVSDVSVIALG